jgi:HEAT repeat protein
LVRDSRPALDALARDASDPVARARALRSLAQLFADASEGTMAGALDDPRAEVRATAVSALGELALPASRRRLLGATEDASPLVRRAAAAALSRYTDSRDVVERLESLARRGRPDAVAIGALAALSLSPLKEATAALWRLNTAQGENGNLVRQVQAALQQQALNAAVGKLPAQFTLRDEEGRTIGSSQVKDPSAALDLAVNRDGKFSADWIAGLSPGLSAKDVPVLKRARSLIAKEAEAAVIVRETSVINTVIRSIWSRR